MYESSHTELSWKKVLSNLDKTYEKFLQKSPLFSKAAGWKPVAVLKMSPVPIIIQGFYHDPE